MLALSNVVKRYADVAVVNDVSLEVVSGSTTVLIGPSGCGKSTLLRMMVGLIAPDEGSVRFRGHELSPAVLVESRLHMGYVIQTGGLFPHLTARENAVLMPKQLGWDRERTDARVGELTQLARFDQELLDRYPAQLSGGQRQRVSLMRALMLDPDIILLDEPLGALDPLVRADLQEDLRAAFRALGKAVLLVTHDMGEAGYFGDSIALLKDGKILQQGTLADLVRRPVDPFVTQFINAQRSPLENIEEDP